jgi:hypothetical protein
MPSTPRHGEFGFIPLFEYPLREVGKEKQAPMNTDVFHRHAGVDWPSANECPICELQRHCAEDADTIVRLRQENERLSARVEDMIGWNNRSAAHHEVLERERDEARTALEEAETALTMAIAHRSPFQPSIHDACRHALDSVKKCLVKTRQAQEAVE